MPEFRSPGRLLPITECFRLGEEAQVDFGQGALTRYTNGKYRRPYLFVMTLKYSGKSFRKVVWKADQEIWARLHEEAFRAFGGCCQYVVLDNLKEGVIRPDIYEPELNPVYARDAGALRRGGRSVSRRGIPNRKGTVENAIQHTQSTALKGRKFESIEEQNTWLAHWEERWAAPRIHGRKKRQVLEMFGEEQPHLQAAARWRASASSGRARAPWTMRAWCRWTRSYYAGAAGAAAQRSHGARLRARDRDPGRARRGAAPARRRPLARARSCIPEAGSHLQPLARDRAPARQGDEDRAAHGNAGAGDLRAPGSPRPAGDLRPGEPAAPSHARTTSRRRASACSP